MLDLKRLHIFREVVRLGSFSAAAQALNYTQPAISHQVSRLELELGTRLLHRSSREGLSLTESGRALLPRAESLLAEAAEAVAVLAHLQGSSAPQVRIGAFETASASFVADAIGAVRRADPKIGLTLIEGEAADVLQALAAHAIDIAVVFDEERHPIAPNDLFDLRHLFDDPMLLTLPRQHALAARRQIDLTDLRDADWIEGAARDTPASLILVAACEAAGFEPRIAFNSGNFDVVQQLVAAGVGVALVPQLAFRVANPAIVVRRVKGADPKRRILMATRANTDPAAALVTTRQELELACERWAGRPPPLGA